MSLRAPFGSADLIRGWGYHPDRPWGDYHRAWDFAPSWTGNDPVPAADSGTVSEVTYTDLRGHQVQIDHGNGISTRYHMLRDDVPVKRGQKVQQGQTIGHVAPKKYSSAAAWTGPHVHFETRRNGVPVDPALMTTAPAAAGGGTTPIEEEDMALSQDDINKIVDAVWDHRVGEHGNSSMPNGIVGELISKTFVRAGLASSRSLAAANRAGSIQAAEVDAAELATELRESLGVEFAAEVVRELGKQLSS